MRIVGAVTVCFVDGVGIDLCAAVRLGEPAEEFGVLRVGSVGRTTAFHRRSALFPLSCHCTEIPCQRVAIGGELRIERLCRRNGHSVVQTAARSGGVPALERMTGLDRRARRGGCRRIRLACRGDAGLAINGAAIRACIPRDCQADSRAAIVALSITVRIRMVGVFFTGAVAKAEQVFERLCCVSSALGPMNHKNTSGQHNHR